MHVIRLKNVSKKIKKTIHKTIIRPVTTITEKYKSCLDVFTRKVLKRIYVKKEVEGL